MNSGGFHVEQADRAMAVSPSAIGMWRTAYLEASRRAQSSLSLEPPRRWASYLQDVFTQLALDAGHRRHSWSTSCPFPGDSGNAVFFFVFPMLMVGIITVLVLLQRAQTWSIEHRVLAVAGMGAVGAAAAYITVVDLDALPTSLRCCSMLSFSARSLVSCCWVRRRS